MGRRLACRGGDINVRPVSLGRRTHSDGAMSITRPRHDRDAVFSSRSMAGCALHGAPRLSARSYLRFAGQISRPPRAVLPRSIKVGRWRKSPPRSPGWAAEPAEPQPSFRAVSLRRARISDAADELLHVD